MGTSNSFGDVKAFDSPLKTPISIISIIGIVPHLCNRIINLITVSQNIPSNETGYPRRRYLMEKRSIKRYSINASTACGHLTTSAHEKIYDGKMLNYSSNGVCIESSSDQDPGNNI